jgi:hypothetical protein
MREPSSVGGKAHRKMLIDSYRTQKDALERLTKTVHGHYPRR